MAEYKKFIENMCKYCIYDPSAKGSWRRQVENCNAYQCPLWKVRPLSLETNNNPTKRKQALTLPKNKTTNKY